MQSGPKMAFWLKERDICFSYSTITHDMYVIMCCSSTQTAVRKEVE